MNSTQKLAAIIEKVSNVHDLCIARNEHRWADVRLMIVEYIYNYGVFTALTDFDDVHLFYPEIRGRVAKLLTTGATDEDCNNDVNYELQGIISVIMDLAGGIRMFVEKM